MGLPAREVGPIRQDVDHFNLREKARRTGIKITSYVALSLGAVIGRVRHPKKGLSGVNFNVTHGSAGTQNLIQTVLLQGSGMAKPIDEGTRPRSDHTRFKLTI